jgi:two-component system, LytTR family, response regulator LytT
MRIAICDDESSEREKISDCLMRYAEAKMLDIERTMFENAERLIADFDKSVFQIVFLDIYMKGLSGIEAAFQIREQSEDCAIVLITTSPDFRAEGFDVGAVHYLLKPVTYESISKAMRRCERFLSVEERFILVQSDRQLRRVRLNDVIYIEVFGKRVLIHTPETMIETRTSLAEIEQMLGGSSFLRCHRCYIVNMGLIADILENDFLMKNGEKVPIRKNGGQKAKEVYRDFLFRSVRETLK